MIDRSPFIKVFGALSNIFRSGGWDLQEQSESKSKSKSKSKSNKKKSKTTSTSWCGWSA